jgi:hypothetical protein
MSETIQDLLARLNAIPEPKDKGQKKDIELLKTTGLLVSQLPSINGTPEQIVKILSTNAQGVTFVASRLGFDHEAVVIVTQMMTMVKEQVMNQDK